MDRKELLLTMQGDLQRRVEKIGKHKHTPLDSDWRERVVELSGEEVREELEHEGLEELELISAALKRMEQGTYGICIGCNEKISDKRLDAVPYAAKCKGCA